jgi:integrase
VITDKAMQAKAGSRDVWLIEPGVRGAGRLVGRITPAGARSFYYRYTTPAGERVRLLIGHYDSRGDGQSKFTVQQARDRARDWAALYRAGTTDLRRHFEQRERDKDSRRIAAEQEERRRQAEAEAAASAAQARPTLRKLFEQWRWAELTPQTLADGTRTGRKDGGDWVRQAFERRVFPRLGDVAAADVRRAELLAILDECKAGGTLRTAQMLFTDLRQMFRFAVEREIVPINPLDGIKRSRMGGKPTERERVLSNAELAMLRTGVPHARIHPRSAAAVWLILSTAVRIGEAMCARWEHVDFERRTWYLPDTKNQRDHTIHLSDFALEQFNALAAHREIGLDGQPLPWVFPNSAGRGPVCIKTFGKQLADRQRPAERRLKGRSKETESLMLPGGRWTAHDLRRTAATVMAMKGVSTDVIDECLNHKSQSRMAKVYIHDRRQQEQRRAFDLLGETLAKLPGHPYRSVGVVRVVQSDGGYAMRQLIAERAA